MISRGLLGLWLLFVLHAVLAFEDHPRFLNRNFKDFRWGEDFTIEYAGLSQYGGNLWLATVENRQIREIELLEHLKTMGPSLSENVTVNIKPDYPTGNYCFQVKENDGGNFDLSEDIFLENDSYSGTISALGVPSATSSETETLSPFTSDLGSVTTITTSTTSTSTTSEPAPTTSEDTPDRSTESQGSTSKLEKAGIGIGAGLGGLLVIGSVGYLFYRRRVRKGKRSTVDSGESAGHANKDKTKIGAVEAEGRPVAELPE